MAHYLVQLAYTPEAWAALVKNPQDRIAAIKPVLEKMGGKIDSAYFAFGDHDLIAIMQMPANVDAAAFALAVAASGSVKSFKTTPLLSIADGVEAMKKAAGSGYTPPKG